MKGLETRVADRSVLGLIRTWLKTPVIEQPRDDEGRPKGPPRITRPTTGTPQGGVISPLLSNTYLHWMDRAFHGANGPARWANARLVRYADDFVILTRHVGRRLTDWVEHVVEQRLELTLNHAKTRVVNLNRKGASLDFLGYTFRYDRDLRGRKWRYLNVFPSDRSVRRIRGRMRQLIGPSSCFVPATVLIGKVNRTLNGWTGYFGGGYPAMAFRDVEAFVLLRLIKHLNRRSQRRYRWPKDSSCRAHLEHLGFRFLSRLLRDPLTVPRQR